MNVAWTMVLLRHDLPDGTWHLDWMLETRPDEDDPQSRSLATFRLSDDPRGVAIGAGVPGERIGAHRRAYLTFEGEIDGGRGRVRRLASGRASVVRDAEGEIEFEAAFDGGGSARWHGRRRGDAWRLERIA